MFFKPVEMITVGQLVKAEMAQNDAAIKITLYLSSLITLLAIVTLF